MKRAIRKGCKVFFVYIMNGNENDNKLKLEDIPVLEDFEDIFLEEVFKLPLKRDMDLMINLIPKSELALKAPYQMKIIQLTELKSQL